MSKAGAKMVEQKLSKLVTPAGDPRGQLIQLVCGVEMC